jgi:hypothetical protein
MPDMRDLPSIPSLIDTRRSSLADVESKLIRLIPALDAFASELAATPRLAKRLAELCNESIAAAPGAVTKPPRDVTKLKRVM